MNFEDKFTQILKEGEVIKRTYKPNKFKYWLSNGLRLFFLLVMLLGFAWIASMTEVDENNPGHLQFSAMTFGIYAGIIGLIIILVLVYRIFFYRNLYYGVTNERIVIRKGVFGTDFKSLDMSMIGAQNVHVTLLDKIARRNTGSLVFGSNSSPITPQGGTFMLKDILDPYNESRFIKSVIDEYRENNK